MVAREPAGSVSRDRGSATWRSSREFPWCPWRSTARRGVRGWRKAQFPKVTIQYGEPLTFEAVEHPSREQAQEVAERVFEPVREMYAALEEKGRRGVIKSLREGIGARTEHQVPAGQPR